MANNPTDQQALTLTHAIALQESGNNGKPNYNAVGDAGTSKGAYQWQPGNFEAAAKNAGLDPADFSPVNQDKVAYSQVKAYKDKGYDPGQIASLWNSGSPNNWQNHSGTTTINGKTISYDTPGYVKGVQKHYQQLAGSVNTNSSGYNPTPYSNPANGANPGAVDYSGTNNPVTEASTQEGLGGKALDVAKGVGNFLFPVVGDITSALQGKGNGKTGLQVLGDTALSALPFIPGLGEVGEGLRGAEAGIEGAGALADATKAGSFLSKVQALPTAVKGAGVGYGAGVASNLSQGQGSGQSFMPNASTIGGAVLGGAAPLLTKSISGLIKKAAGVSPQMANDLASIGANDTKGFAKYMDAARQRTQSSMVPSAVNLAANDADTAAQKLKTMVSQAGSDVGAANRASATVKVNPTKVAPLAAALNDALDSFGIKIGTKEDGTLAIVPTRAGGVPLSPLEKTRVLDVASRINEMGTNGNVRMLDDLMTVLDKQHGEYGIAPDPLKGIFGQIRHQVNEVARTASPEFGAANDKLSTLKTLLDETQAMAGKDTQRGELLMRRVFTGDKGADVQELFNKIKATTGIDLKKSALFAKYATEAFGNQDDKTLLEKMISGTGIGGVHGGLMAGLLHGVSSVAKRITNPERVGRNLIKGSTPGMIPGLITKGAARVGSAL